MASDPVDTLEQQNEGEHGHLSPPVAPIIGGTDPESRLVAYIQERLDGVPPLYPECCIYRVPERLRKINEAAYTPQFVSIGPFHHGKENLKVQETLKWQHLRSFIGRNRNVTLSQYVKTIKGLEERIRKCYAEIISFSCDEFVRMMLVDGCFILEYMFRIVEEQRSNPWFLNAVPHDLILLENQLPLFVLEDLYELNEGGYFSNFTSMIRAFSIIFANITVKKEELREKSKGKCSQKIKDLLAFVRNHYCCSSSSGSSHGLPRDNNIGEGANPAILSTVVDMPETTPKRHLLDSIRDCFNPSSSPTKKGNSEEQLERPSQDETMAVEMPKTDDASSRLLNCTSLLYPWKQRNCFIPSSPPAANASLSGNKKLQRPHNVTALYKAGVKFEVGSEGKFLLDITFENGVLTIPCIRIYDNTESLLRNMIAFEQLHCLDPHYSTYITDYADLLDSLIDTSKDVELLNDHGIIENGLGDHEEVSLLFNKLVKEVIVDDDDNYYFYRLCQDLSAYHRFWHEWVADLKRTYFNTPWTAISVIAAAVLIGLTILQTIYTIKSYTKE